jgi:peroxisomal 3,2-trans-enoyl-CoA isomerase
VSGRRTEFKNDGEKKIYWVQELATATELVRSLIEHKKVLVLAMNGPGVGAGASWFQGSSDLFYMADDAWLSVTFSELGLIPESGSAINWANSIGVHRANDWLMFGGKATAQELQQMGMVNKLFPKQGFHESVHDYLKGMLSARSGKSMMEMKRLQNKSIRDQRILALFEAWQALAERFVDGEPSKRMKAKMEELAGEYIPCLTLDERLADFR